MIKVGKAVFGMAVANVYRFKSGGEYFIQYFDKKNKVEYAIMGGKTSLIELKKIGKSMKKVQ